MNWTTLRKLLFLLCAITISSLVHAQITNNPPHYGPFNAEFLAGGPGLVKPLVAHDTVLRADSPWSLYLWIKPDEAIAAPTLIAGMGDPEEEYPRYLALDSNRLFLWMGVDNSLSAQVTLIPAKWHFIGAVFDGTEFHLYSDGVQVAHGPLTLGSVSAYLQMAPSTLPKVNWRHFGGKIASLTILRNALSPAEVQQVYGRPADFTIVEYEHGSKPWPVQTRGQAGYDAPQPPDTVPHSKAPFSEPVKGPLPPATETLEAEGDGNWNIAGNWRLSTAPEVHADGAAISTGKFDAKSWWPATVPGTVLTTMVNRGVYPDPDYGLNNLAIPESLNKQDYWYRTEFKAPKSLDGRHLTLTFQGINYKADVWLNGQQLGTIKGAFIRGVFDVTRILKSGQLNVLAVRVSPPPHPGIPQEQSIKGGPGGNGGMMCLDGPTFVATEGWDWIPAIRDRDTGIWQPVIISAGGAVNIGDPQVVTKLPLPDISSARVDITVPLENLSDKPVHGRLNAAFEKVSITKDVTLAPGSNTVKLTPAEFAQLTVQNPRLWWPNGYGKPELYHLKLTFTEDGKTSDVKQLRFGIREITYELSLLDNAGHLRRVEFDPTATGETGPQVVDVTHQGMREIPSSDPKLELLPDAEREQVHGWVASVAHGEDASPALRTIADTQTAPYLVIKVNGVRIACRGGNWGMDDARKRVSRARLEPYFRLDRDAHLNIIRNWVGQSTEEVFYDLADEYGMLVWNDFWDSTENYNLEAEDPALFLKNARDTILRFRNHPSIVIWCGRNEGVPQPIINDGLANLVHTLDGTRYYNPSSNEVNLQGSGPYRYQDPADYYTILNRGFSVETGTPSMSTLESFEAWIPKADQWPVDDVWAYHDWHQKGNGDVAPFMAEMQAEFGAPTSLADFERKAQMLNYVDHRAIFEGMDAHLWSPNSGRLLWMTQPAWPSTMWQILSSDYDTQASFYGVEKACEPVHVQLNLATYGVAVVNTTTVAQPGLMVNADVYSLQNKLLLHSQAPLNAGADATTDSIKLALAPLMSSQMVLVKLQLHNSAGQELSSNLYWLGADSRSYRELTRLAPADVSATATSVRGGGMMQLHVHLQNTGADVSLENKLTLLNAADGARILPAYYSDNYVSLLPGESRDLTIEYPVADSKQQPEVTLRGWNLPQRTVAIAR